MLNHLLPLPLFGSPHGGSHHWKWQWEFGPICSKSAFNDTGWLLNERAMGMEMKGCVRKLHLARLLISLLQRVAICFLFLLLLLPICLHVNGCGFDYICQLVLSCDCMLCHLFMGRSFCANMEITHRSGVWQMEIYHALCMSCGSGDGKVIYIPHHTPASSTSSFPHLCPLPFPPTP